MVFEPILIMGRRQVWNENLDVLVCVWLSIFGLFVFTVMLVVVVVVVVVVVLLLLLMMMMKAFWTSLVLFS
jgi:hypothetical protein